MTRRFRIKTKQKLLGRNTYIPTDVPQVCSSVVLSLNKAEGRSSVASLKTPNNPSDAVLTLTNGGLKDKKLVLVYVINKDGKPLMPCKPTKARHLLKNNETM